MTGEPRKWSTTEFLIGKLKNSFLVWVFSTIFVIIVLSCSIFLKIIPIDSVFNWIFAIGWFAVSIFFIFESAISKAVENMKITAELKAGTQANINGDANKIIEALGTVTKGGNNE